MPGNHYRWFALEGQLLLSASGEPHAERLNEPADDDFYVGPGEPFEATGHIWISPRTPRTWPNGAQLTGLRDCLSWYSPDQFGLAGRALQIEHWWRTHQYCGRCSCALAGPGPRQQRAAELVRFCPGCEARYYPRLSPCVIVLVRRGAYCLLARHRRARRPVYTTLAGFIEAGECAEQTVMREVLEETNIQVDGLRYTGSQSWPFPGQLMLGFYADYHSGRIRPQPDEIVDADWFHYRSLPTIPPAGTIARQLIDGFVRDCDNTEQSTGRGNST